MNAHFKERKQHTEIKHKLFYDTFVSILGISAKFSKNNSFTYIDLYAGKGKFSDENVGSPLLAFNAILDSKHILSAFHKVKCFFSEENKDNAEELYLHTKQLSESGNTSNVKVFIREGAWSQKDEKLNEFLQYSKWGFIFIDPFANEVELDNLFHLIKEKCKMIDFMLFINTQSLKRIAGLNTKNNDIANFLGIEVSQVTTVVKNNELIRKALQKRFEETNKDYILNASIPTTRNNKLINTDNFQLILGTNSIGVSDAFLTSYVESLKLFKDSIPLNLFDTLENDIYEIIKEYKKLSINKIIQEIYKNNNSWKYADIHNLPTTDNICSAVNNMLRRGVISFDAPEKYINKKNNTIKKEVFKKNSKMKEISIYKVK